MNSTDIQYSHILAPVDFSETSRKAFYTAVGYARTFRAHLTILHVNERNLAMGGFEDVEEQSATMERLEAGIVRRLDELQADGHVTDDDRERMTLEISAGKPWMEILRFAMDQDVDLIVMGTHGHTGFRRMLIGSQAEKVVRRAGCDVLSVKPAGYEPGLDLDRD
ncbi:MAG: universal stress protein [Myxococcota bacterium]